MIPSPDYLWRDLLNALSSPAPQDWLHGLRAEGRLATLFPDLARLFGVPQPARHHPEVDTGLHLLLSLEQAARLTSDPVVRFAVLVHDLGKGNTLPAIWPHHYGHEQRSARLVHQWCRRLPVPPVFARVALKVARYHTHCHKLDELNPKTALKTLYALEAFDQPEDFERFLLACEADARGRLGLEQRPYPQAARFRALRDAAARAEVETLWPGVPHQDALHRARLRGLKEAGGS